MNFHLLDGFVHPLQALLNARVSSTVFTATAALSLILSVIVSKPTSPSSTVTVGLTVLLATDDCFHAILMTKFYLTGLRQTGYWASARLKDIQPDSLPGVSAMELAGCSFNGATVIFTACLGEILGHIQSVMFELRVLKLH